MKTQHSGRYQGSPGGSACSLMMRAGSAAQLPSLVTLTATHPPTLYTQHSYYCNGATQVQCPGRRVLHVQPRGHQSDSVREPPLNVSDLVQAFVPLSNGGGTKLYLNPSEAGLYSEGQHHERLKYHLTTDKNFINFRKIIWFC